MRRATWILILSVVVLNVASQAYAMPMTTFIRERSTSVTTDMALRFAYFAFMLITAFVEALLFDELVYRGGWRKRFFGGQRGEAALGRHRLGADVEVAAPDSVPTALAPEDEAVLEEALNDKRGGLRALVAENSIPFFIAFFLLLGANYLLFNVMNGWFDLYYSRTGHLMTQLRSPDPKEREQAILGLSPHRGETIERRLVERLEQGTPGERLWAAWSFGYRRRLKLPLKGPATLDRGEAALLKLLEGGTPDQRGAAAVALARTVARRGENAGANVPPALRAHLEGEVKAGQVSLQTVVAMGYLREKTAVPALGALLTQPGADRAMATAWALGRMQHPSAVGPLLAALGATKPQPAAPQARCAIVEALGHLGNAARVSKRLMDEFNRKGSGFECEAHAVTLRPDGRGKQIHDKLHLVGAAEVYRVKLLKILGKVGFLDDALPWLRRISEPGSPYAQRVRRYAGEQYRSLQRQIARER